MIDKIRNYISKCPYLNDFNNININYLIDKVKSYSINEAAGYNPHINTYINGDKEMQFKFSFDAKFHWNKEIANNLDNSLFFENFRNWLERNDEEGIYPIVPNGIVPLSISAITDGYIFATNSDEAIYRIDCVFNYIKEKR